MATAKSGKATGHTRSSKAPRLGRGLSSLMAQTARVELDGVAASLPRPEIPRGSVVMPQITMPPLPPPPAIPAPDGLHRIPLDAIEPNRYQPRSEPDGAGLEQLAASIRADGLMQPIIVRPMEKAGRYELVAGERRWRAARIAQVKAIPAIVRKITDQQAAEWALIENLQREDLNPIDRAEAFARLADQFQMSHQQIGERMGLDRSTVANLFRLLDLCDDVRRYVRDGLLSMGQARAIAGLSDAKAQQLIAQAAVKRAMSVRQVEEAVRRVQQAEGGPASGSAAGGKSAGRSQAAAHLADFERQIGEQLHTRVAIKPGRKKGTGTMTIEFFSYDDFEALLGRLGVRVE